MQLRSCLRKTQYHSETWHGAKYANMKFHLDLELALNEAPWNMSNEMEGDECYCAHWCIRCQLTKNTAVAEYHDISHINVIWYIIGKKVEVSLRLFDIFQRNMVFSRGHATLHLAVSVRPSVRPSEIFLKLRAVFALLPLPNRPRLDCRVSGLVF